MLISPSWYGAYLLCFCFSIVIGSDALLRDTSKVKDLVTRFWDWRLQTSPEYGTKYGFHNRDEQLEQFTPEHWRKTVVDAATFRAEANMIDTAHLSQKDQTSLAVLKDTLSTYISGYQYRHYGLYMTMDIFGHPINEMANTVSWMAFKTEMDFKRAIQRYRAFAIKFEQQQELMTIAMNKNMTGPNVTKLDTFIESYISWPNNANETSLFEPFKNISGILGSDTLARTLTNEVLEVIKNRVTPAIRKFGDFLQTKYKSHLRSKPGVFAMPNGKAFYAACLKWHLSLNLTAQQVHDLGLQEVLRISNLMEKIKEEDGYDGTLRSYLLHLKQDPKHLFNTEDEIVDTFKRYIRDVHGHLKKVLAKVPNYPIRIGRASSPNSPNRYTEQSLDGTRPAEFTANVWYPKTNVRFSKLALTLHEAEPGHHTQMSTMIDSDMPNFRRATEFRKYGGIPFNWPFYTAYVEGWALYAESLGEDMGLYTEKYDLLGRYTSEIFRACRLVIDTGIHHFGWSFQDAVDYLEMYTALSKNVMEVEVTRYIYYPGQATSYKIGELTILRLRKLAEKQLGDKFDIREFNTAVLDLGPAPLTILEEHIKRWIEVQKHGVRAEASRENSATSGVLPNYILFLVTVISCFNGLLKPTL